MTGAGRTEEPWWQLSTPLRRTGTASVTQPVTAATWTRQFTVDAMGAGLMISEFARRHIARQATWGRIIGLTSGGDLGFPEEVSYGAAKAAQENYTMSAAFELAPFGITAHIAAQARSPRSSPISLPTPPP